MQPSNTLQGLVPLAAYAAQHDAIFPSEASARWFVRQHRDALRKANALYMVQRRMLVDPAAFAGVVRDIGRKAA